MQIKFAIIGTAHNHVYSFINAALSHKNVKFAGIADSDPIKCQELRDNYSCPVFNNWRDLLDAVKPDAVGTAEINGQRGEIAIECARRGIHIISDKPLLTDLSELAELESIFADNPKWICSTAFTLRFSEEGQTIKKILREGVLGKPASFYGCRTYKLGDNRPSWMFDKNSYGGIITDIGSHDIDLIRWFFETEFIEATSCGKNIRFTQYHDFDDSAQIFLRCLNGLNAMLDINWLAPDSQDAHNRTTVIIGSKGILKQYNSKFFLSTDSLQEYELQGVKSDDSVVNQFFECCLGNNDKISVTTEESLKSTKASLLVQRSVNSNSTIKLK